ncbi:hypothetical protein B0H13DRAFT_2378791 [Mycena leptocephala]|nr:hypothetical protein B0H13DRAFT_2378791 [Mycena leptocephala]
MQSKAEPLVKAHRALSFDHVHTSARSTDVRALEHGAYTQHQHKICEISAVTSTLIACLRRIQRSQVPENVRYASTRSDLHQCIGVCAALSTPSNHTRLSAHSASSPPSQLRMEYTCAEPSRSSQTSREVRAQSRTSPVRSHAETSTPHVGIRIRAIAIACAHMQLPLADIFTRVPCTRHHHEHACLSPRRADPFPAALRDIHGARRLSHQHPAQELAPAPMSRTREIRAESVSSTNRHIRRRRTRIRWRRGTIHPREEWRFEWDGRLMGA